MVDVATLVRDVGARSWARCAREGFVGRGLGREGGGWVVGLRLGKRADGSGSEGFGLFIARREDC